MFGRNKVTLTQNTNIGGEIKPQEVSKYPEEWMPLLIVEMNGILQRIEHHLAAISHNATNTNHPTPIKKK